MYGLTHVPKDGLTLTLPFVLGAGLTLTLTQSFCSETHKEQLSKLSLNVNLVHKITFHGIFSSISAEQKRNQS